MSNSYRWWWLSFCDDLRPSGAQFLGVTVVQGRNLIEAVSRAHWIGINPGGEVSGIEVRGDVDPPDALRDRLVSDKAILDDLRWRWLEAIDAAEPGFS